VASLVQRAEACGCKAIVLTLDTTMLGWRTKDLSLGYLPFMEGKGIAQYTSDPVFQRLMDESMRQVSDIKPKITLSAIEGLIKATSSYPGNNFFEKLKSGRPMAAIKLFTALYTNPALTWDDLSFLRGITKLPIILKGILHPDDARKALDHGMDGIIVSNHGGRQVDGAISTIEALPAVIKAVAGQVPVLMDSGVRGGADMFKAIALGAKAVCIGRPYIYGLALDGQQGIEAVIKHFMADFELTMRLAGCKNIDEISVENLVKQ
jgi:lactate 2-monooxygenase